MQVQALDQVIDAEADKGQHDEQHAVLGRAQGLGIHIDRVDQTDLDLLAMHRVALGNGLLQLVLSLGSQRGHGPAGAEAAFTDLTPGRRERPAERRVRPARYQLHPVVIGYRQQGQGTGAIQRQFQLQCRGWQAASLIGYQRHVYPADAVMQALGTCLQQRAATIQLQDRRTHHPAHIGNTHHQVGLAVHPPGYAGRLERSKACGQLAAPGVYRYLEHAYTPLLGQQLAIHLQLLRHLQFMAVHGAHALPPLLIDTELLLRPRDHPQRAGQHLLARPAGPHPGHGLVTELGPFTDQ